MKVEKVVLKPAVVLITITAELVRLFQGVPVATAFLAAVMLIVEAMQVAVRVYQQSGVEMEEAAVRVIIIIMVAQAARVQGVANT